MGGELKAFYLVMGQYDAVVISEAPDDETATRFALATGARGYVHTQTLLAYTEAEYGRSSRPYHRGSPPVSVAWAVDLSRSGPARYN
jgi:hypothetical protein